MSNHPVNEVGPEIRPGDRVRIPDDGWGRSAEATVMSVKESTVYIERDGDGAIAGFWPHDVTLVRNENGEGEVK